MIKIKYKESGITLVALILTIILLLILATITAYNGIDSYKKSKVMKFIAEMQLIQGKVDAMANSNEYNRIGTAASGAGMESLSAAIENNELTSNESANSENYRYLTVNDIANYLEIDNATSDIIVNFNTREVISVDGIDYNGEQHYTQYSLPGGQSLIVGNSLATRTIQNFQVEITSINGLNATFTISRINITNGSLAYKLSNDSSWTTISNYTKSGQEYEVNVSVSGEYLFKLIDNTNKENFNQIAYGIVLTNAPKLEEGMTLRSPYYTYANYENDSRGWAIASIESTNYVWIPRYAYKGDDIKFIRGNSKIATDDTYLDSTWTVPDKFTPNDTGIWVEITQENSGNLLALINDN